MKRTGWEPHYTKRNEGVDMRGKMLDDADKGPKVQTSRSIAVVLDKRTPAVQFLGESTVENMTRIPKVVRVTRWKIKKMAWSTTSENSQKKP